MLCVSSLLHFIELKWPKNVINIYEWLNEPKTVMVCVFDLWDPHVFALIVLFVLFCFILKCFVYFPMVSSCNYLLCLTCGISTHVQCFLSVSWSVSLGCSYFWSSFCWTVSLWTLQLFLCCLNQFSPVRDNFVPRVCMIMDQWCSFSPAHFSEYLTLLNSL